MKTLAQPVKTSERIQLLDMLRGLAIFGILMVNMQIFYQPMTTMLARTSAGEMSTNLFSEIFIKFFFEGKFYVMFSLLFGYGFYLFMNKKLEGGRSIVPVFRRRVFFLLLFGILHVVLLWPGDILVYYALFGFVLLLFRKKTNRSLIKWAVWLAAVPVILTGIFTLFFALISLVPEGREEIMAQVQANTQQMKVMVDNFASVYANGSFAEITSVRIQEYIQLLPGIFFFYPVVLAMFLIGFWAGRKKLFENYQQHLSFFRKSIWWFLATGLLLNLLMVYGFLRSTPQMMDFHTFLQTLGQTIGGILLSFFYISGIVLLKAGNKTGKLEKLLAPVGRMALTNYLLQSVICTTLFYGYGFGLFGQISALTGIFLSIIIFLLQIPLSRLWLKHFHYGPMEWLWRSLTYMKLQPFKKKGKPENLQFAGNL